MNHMAYVPQTYVAYSSHVLVSSDDAHKALLYHANCTKMSIHASYEAKRSVTNQSSNRTFSFGRIAKINCMHPNSIQINVENPIYDDNLRLRFLELIL